MFEKKTKLIRSVNRKVIIDNLEFDLRDETTIHALAVLNEHGATITGIKLCVGSKSSEKTPLGGIILYITCPSHIWGEIEDNLDRMTYSHEKVKHFYNITACTD